MIGLFCFDGPLYRDKNGIYCNITLTDEMFKRFFSVVDELIITVRTFKSNKTYQELNMKPLTIQNIKVVEVDNLNSIRGFLIDKKKFETKIKKHLQNIDLIFARMPSNTSNSVIKIARAMKKPYLVEVGGCAWDSFWNHGLTGKIIAPLMYYREKINVKNADFATYVTKEFLQKRYPNCHINTNCSNVYLQPVSTKVLEERLIKIKNTDVNYLVFGQALNCIDVKYKGAHLFVKVMGILKKKGIIVEFQLVGTGTGRYIKKEAEKWGVANQIKILGTMKKEEIYIWLKGLDVYVQPSKQEGLPRSVIEAMSVGCPAIGSNLAGIPELLDKQCLFNPNKKDEIVDAVKRMMDKDFLKEMAEKNFKRAKIYNINDIESRRQKIFLQYAQYVEKLNKFIKSDS